MPCSPLAACSATDPSAAGHALLWLWALAGLATLLLWAWDKGSAACGARRVPEALLVGSAWLGGFAGALLASYLLRHKTRHRWLQSAVWAAALAQFALLALLW